ncbi:MAG TPA: hypothetical protein VEB86_10930 [Chryseosolibacter sp.]|nr:hypothetical protein [Chryseosolibacter sp.]
MPNRIVNVVINYDVNTEGLRKGEDAAQKADKATEALRNDAKGLGDDFQKSGAKASSALSGLGKIAGVVAATLATISLAQLVKDSFQLAAQMQKLGAVLQNTLGSRSAAQQALREIQAFAAKTPFQVIGLTEAFTKLANRGVVPAMNEMRALGDISAVLGKDFMQLVEAILDIDNDVRWKELGINVQSAGDKIKLSFRGVNVETERTVEGVKNAIVQLGNLKGVSGTMASVSATLGGKWSNLVDNLEIIGSTIGGKGSGVAGALLDLANNIFGALNKSLNDNVKALQSEQTELNVLVGAITAANVPTEVRSTLIDQLNRKYPDFLKNLNAEKVTNEQLTARLQDVNNQFMRKIALTAAEERFRDVQEDILDLIDDEVEARKRLEAVRTGAIVMRPPTTKGGAEGLTDEQAKRQEIFHLEGRIKEIQAEREAIQDQLTQRLNEYNSALSLFDTKAKDYFESETKNAQAAKNHGDALKKLAEDVNNYLAYLSDLEMFQTRQLLDEKQEQRKQETDQREEDAERQREMDKTSFEHWKYYNDLRRKKEKEAADERIAIEEDAALRQKEIMQDLQQAAFTFAQGLVDFMFARREEDLTGIHDFYDRQLELAGDNERARKEIEIKKDAEMKRARDRQKDEMKKDSINRIIAETAINVAEAFPNYVQMGLAAALGALQIGTVKRLNKGEIDIKGPGTTTSDSIPALLSRGESVMTARETQHSKGILKAIRAGKLSDQALKDVMRSGRNGTVFSDAKIVGELAEIKAELQANRPADVVERHGILMKATKKARDYKQYVRKSVMGDY